MNIMEKVFVWMFVFVFVAGGVYGLEDDWGGVNSGDEEAGSGESEAAGSDKLPDVFPESEKKISKGGKFFTEDFYIALGLGVFVLFIFVLFVWFWIRGSKNNWE